MQSNHEHTESDLERGEAGTAGGSIRSSYKPADPAEGQSIITHWGHLKISVCVCVGGGRRLLIYESPARICCLWKTQVVVKRKLIFSYWQNHQRASAAVAVASKQHFLRASSASRSAWGPKPLETEPRLDHLHFHKVRTCINFRSF